MKVKEFKPQYSGPRSRKFWGAIDTLRGKTPRSNRAYDVMYSAGCLLQDFEKSILNILTITLKEKL